MYRQLDKIKDESGFMTMIVVIMALFVGALLVAAAFSFTTGDSTNARHDQYYKEAYNAAEAGVNYYFDHLTQDQNFWAQCTTASGVFAKGTSWASATPRSIPGSEARYMIEILPAPGSSACSTQSTSVIDPLTGALKIRSTGEYRGVRRSVIATFKRNGFLNFLWFTNFETPDPLTYSSSQQSSAATYCSQWERDGRPQSSPPFACADQSFITGDVVNGPLHTNDELAICGTPSFGRNSNDAIEVSDPTGWRSTCAGSAPTFNGTKKFGASVITMPPSNSSLTTNADPSWIFTGPIHVTLLNTGVKVTGPAPSFTVLKSGTTFPPKGIVYAKSNGTCSTTWATAQTYATGDNCGNVYVHGAAPGDITIGADNDIVVDGNLTHGTGTVIGLIANGFVRVYHPCTSDTNGTTSPEDPGLGAMTNPEIDAAILAINHSWALDNDNCGNPLGTLNVKGAIAQEFRGTIGHHSGGTPTAGYIKGYSYDDGLRFHQPPYFLDPVQASWELFSQTEQVPAH